MTPAVLTVSEAAALLRLSVSTVGEMTRDGRLPRVSKDAARRLDEAIGG